MKLMALSGSAKVAIYPESASEGNTESASEGYFHLSNFESSGNNTFELQRQKSHQTFNENNLDEIICCVKGF